MTPPDVFVTQRSMWNDFRRFERRFRSVRDRHAPQRRILHSFSLRAEDLHAVRRNLSIIVPSRLVCVHFRTDSTIFGCCGFQGDNRDANM